MMTEEVSAQVDKLELRVWLPASAIEYMLKNDAAEPWYTYSDSDVDMSQKGWKLVKELTVEVPRLSRGELMRKAILALSLEEQELKRKFAEAMLALSVRRESMLALENGE